MAKVTSPLFSLEAKGGIANNTIIYRSRRLKTSCHVFVKPTKHKKTEKRIKAQEAMKAANEYWKNLSEHDKKLWINCKYTVRHGNNNSPWRPEAKGRSLFLSQAIRYIHIGQKPISEPYGNLDAPSRIKQVTMFQIIN